jgi:plasmid stabilization system protein ParE
LTGVRDYIGQFAPLAAQRFAARLVHAVETLKTQPARGRIVGDTIRELTIIAPYVIRYEITDEAV